LGHVLGAYDLKTWNQVKAFRSKVAGYQRRVKLSEQPFSKVRNAVDDVRRRTGRGVSFGFDESILQTKGLIMATSLMLRLDLALLVAYLLLKQPVKPSGSKQIPEIGFNVWMNDCRVLLEDASATKRAPQQVEAYVYLAEICAVQRSRAPEGRSEELCLEGMEYLTQANLLCAVNASQTRGLQEEILAIETMLRESTFYSPVSSEERRSVIQAMAREMRGTGHWYYCENAHPFTIGECGMPMEMATCPECSAPVGGSDHTTVAGNRHATDLESQYA